MKNFRLTTRKDHYNKANRKQRILKKRSAVYTIVDSFYTNDYTMKTINNNRT